MNPKTVLLLVSFGRLKKSIKANPPATASEVIARLTPFTELWQKEGESEDYCRARVAEVCKLWANAIASKIMEDKGGEVPEWIAAEAMIELSTAFTKKVAELPTDQANTAAAHRIEWPLLIHAAKTGSNAPTELGAKSNLKKRRKRPSPKSKINIFAKGVYFAFQREREKWPKGLAEALPTEQEEEEALAKSAASSLAMLPEILALPDLSKKTASRWGVLAFKHTDSIYGGKIEDEPEFEKYAAARRERKGNSNGATIAIRSQRREGIREAFVRAFKAMASG